MTTSSNGGPDKDPADIFTTGLKLIGEAVKGAFKETKEDVWGQVTREGGRRFAEAMAGVPRQPRKTAAEKEGDAAKEQNVGGFNFKERLVLELASRAVDALEKISEDVREINERGKKKGITVQDITVNPDPRR